MRDVRIILVRPRNPVNIGAVARAMANFGYTDLVVVNPHPPVWEEARRGGPGGGTILDAARVAGTVAEAIAGCSRVAGTTSAARRELDLPPIAPDRLRWRGRLALLFGSEKTGLSNDDMSYCAELVRIPTTAGAPSMNLGQAVAVVCYELARRRLARAVSPAKAPPPAGVEDRWRLLELGAPLLEAAGFLDTRTRAARMARLRRLVMRANLTGDEAKLLTAAVHQISRWRVRA